MSREDGRVELGERGRDLGGLLTDERLREAATEVSRVAVVDDRVGVVFAVVEDVRIGDAEDGSADAGFVEELAGEHGRLDAIEELAPVMARPVWRRWRPIGVGSRPASRLDARGRPGVGKEAFELGERLAGSVGESGHR
jgi:hypothetical protein